MYLSKTEMVRGGGRKVVRDNNEASENKSTTQESQQEWLARMTREATTEGDREQALRHPITSSSYYSINPRIDSHDEIVSSRGSIAFTNSSSTTSASSAFSDSSPSDDEHIQQEKRLRPLQEASSRQRGPQHHISRLPISSSSNQHEGAVAFRRSQQAAILPAPTNLYNDRPQLVNAGRNFPQTAERYLREILRIIPTFLTGGQIK